MSMWSNAFKLPEPPEIMESEKEFLSKLALKARGRGMEHVAVLAVESTRPLHNLGAQALVFLMPLLSSIFGREKARKAVALLENSKAVDFFVRELNGANLCQKKILKSSSPRTAAAPPPKLS